MDLRLFKETIRLRFILNVQKSIGQATPCGLFAAQVIAVDALLLPVPRYKNYTFCAHSSLGCATVHYTEPPSPYTAFAYYIEPSSGILQIVPRFICVVSLPLYISIISHIWWYVPWRTKTSMFWSWRFDTYTFLYTCRDAHRSVW